MPTLPELITQLQSIAQESVVLGLFITASIILISRDWRTLIIALLVQYILAGLIMSRLVRPDIATLKVMIGAFICPILFLSARQVSIRASFFTPPTQGDETWWRSFSLRSLLRGQKLRQQPPATAFFFRVVVTALVMMVALTLSNSLTLPGLSPTLTTAVYWLVLAGLVTLTLTEQPIRVGHGLFTIFIGFDLYYTTLERSLLMTGLWGTVNLLLALVIGYLTIIRSAGPEEEW
jgi:hypothetical protein